MTTEFWEPYIMLDSTQCWKCFDGLHYGVCIECKGHGEAGGTTCQACGGVGEMQCGACPVCHGSQEVTRAYAELYQAEERTRRYDPDWSGNSLDYPGITDYGLAHWYRKRKEFRGPATLVQGVINDQGTSQIWIWDTNNFPVRIEGVSWGYGGTGPHGLAAILTDLSLFDSIEEAMKWIAIQPMERGWVIRQMSSPI